MTKRTIFLAVALILAIMISGCFGNPSADLLPQRTNDQAEITNRTGASPKASGKDEHSKPEPTQTMMPEKDYPYLYDEVLLYYCALFENPNMEIESYGGWEPNVGLFEWAKTMAADAIDEVGYMMKDISGDGIPELLIGSISKEQGVMQDYLVYAIYTLKDDIPVLVVDSSNRSAWYWAEDFLVNVGSAGASRSIFGGYELRRNGLSLICRDYYYTQEVDGDYENIGCFYNTTGAMTGAAEEQLNWTVDDFLMEQKKYLYQCRELTLIPLREYQGVGDPSYTESTWLELNWADSTLKFYEGWDNICLTQEEASSEIAFVGGNVDDFTLLSLSATEKDGKPTFDAKTLYEYGSLKEYVPVVVSLTFYGDLPTWGVAYKDMHGIQHRFAINIRGDDGTLELIEF